MNSYSSIKCICVILFPTALGLAVSISRLACKRNKEFISMAMMASQDMLSYVY